MSFQYMDWIEKYNLNFHLYVQEENTIDIFKNSNLQQKVGDLQDLNNGLVNVLATKKINKKYYHKISYEGNTIGWCSPETSVRVFKTISHEIKLSEDVIVPEAINQLFNIDLEVLTNNIEKIFRSNTLAIINNDIYMGITLKSDLIGFVDLKYIKFFTESIQEVNLITENTKLFKDSKLTKKIEVVNSESSNPIQMLGGFEDDSGVRVNIGGKRYWVNSENIDKKITHKRLENMSDIIIDILLFQLKDKLKKQEEFYLNKINTLIDDNKKLIGKEADIKKQLSVIKGLL